MKQFYVFDENKLLYNLSTKELIEFNRAFLVGAADYPDARIVIIEGERNAVRQLVLGGLTYKGALLAIKQIA